MAVAQGYGKTVTSGSVFAYDTGDTRNSYIGEPTTNYIWHQNPRIDASYESYMPEAGNGTITQNHPGAIRVYNGNGTDISYYINTGVGDWTNQRHAYWIYDQILKRPVVRMYNENGSWQSKYYDPGIGSLTNIGVSAGTQYTISWLQYVENLDRCAHVGLYSYSSTNGYNNFWDGTSNGSSTSKNTLTSTWQRVYHVFTATNNGQLGNYHGGYTYGMYGGGGELRVADIQLEVKTHPTQYSNSLTRSSTQGLLPLVGNSTLDLSNVSFDSNAQMTFDGTNDYIAAGNPTDYRMGTSNFTLECVMKQSKTTVHCLLESRGDSLAGYLWVHNYGTAGRGSLFLNYGGNQYVYLQDGGYVATTTTQYYHMVVMANRSAGTLSFYVNGNKVGNDVSIHSNSITPTGGDRYWVGADLGGSPWQGEIPVFKHYNRTLSAAEIRQNYLHYKTRFNLS